MSYTSSGPRVRVSSRLKMVKAEYVTQLAVYLQMMVQCVSGYFRDCVDFSLAGLRCRPSYLGSLPKETL